MCNVLHVCTMYYGLSSIRCNVMLCTMAHHQMLCTCTSYATPSKVHKLHQKHLNTKQTIVQHVPAQIQLPTLPSYCLPAIFCTLPFQPGPMTSY